MYVWKRRCFTHFYRNLKGTCLVGKGWDRGSPGRMGIYILEYMVRNGKKGRLLFEQWLVLSFFRTAI